MDSVSHRKSHLFGINIHGRVLRDPRRFGMRRNSDQASAFIAIATYVQGGENIESRKEVFAFSPNATIAEVFGAIWPKSQAEKIFFNPPSKIEILPDTNSVPSEERGGFFDELDEAAK